MVWWIWVLFAAGNLIDIAVQGRDRSSLVAAFILLAVTGAMYVGAQRPRLIADDNGMTIVNPLRRHRVGWASVTAIDTTDLARVRCEWPAGPAGAAGRKAIYAWAVTHSRRRETLAQLREQRRTRSRPGQAPSGASSGVFSADSRPSTAAPRTPVAGDASSIVTLLRARADEAHATAPETRATEPVSTWSWPALAALGIPLAALLIVLAI